MSQRLVCDDCGSLNERGRASCELCHSSLVEERERARHGSLPVLLLIATGLTLLLFVLPGFVLYYYLVFRLGVEGFDASGEPSINPTTFWGAYVVSWFILSVISGGYKPKDDYDLGHEAGPYRVDRPFTLRDDYDRAHLGLGMALFPVNLVVGSWVAVYRAVKHSV